MKTKYPDFFFENSGGEGPFYVYFEEGPYGNAIDDESGKGAGFFDENNRLIAVLFDHIRESSDHCLLKFKNKQSVEIKINKGKITLLKSTYSKKANEVKSVAS